jgi:hypothetical protein
MVSALDALRPVRKKPQRGGFFLYRPIVARPPPAKGGGFAAKSTKSTKSTEKLEGLKSLMLCGFLKIFA